MQTSDSLAASGSAGPSQPSSNASAATAARNLKMVRFRLSAFTDERLPFNLEDHFMYYKVSCFRNLMPSGGRVSIFFTFPDVIHSPAGFNRLPGFFGDSFYFGR
jgi:hypothetical protein